MKIFHHYTELFQILLIKNSFVLTNDSFLLHKTRLEAVYVKTRVKNFICIELVLTNSSCTPPKVADEFKLVG